MKNIKSRIIYITFFLMLLIVTPLIGEEFILNVLFTNDVHGGIDPTPATFINPDFPPPLGGGASAAVYIDRLREKAKENNEEVLLLDAGDIFQGHPIGTMTKGEAIIKYMNLMEYDAMAPGNHEFDEGYEQFQHLAKQAEFPIVCANIVQSETGEIIPECIPYIIRDFQGVKIAIIGLCTEETAMMSFPENIKGLEFLPVAEVTEKYVKEVREKDADIVMVLGHLGIPYDVESAYQKDIVEGYINDPDRYWPDNAMHLAHKVSGIDIIFGGHIHKGYNKPWEDPQNHTLIFQNYAYGSNIGHVQFIIDKETKSLSGYELPAYIDGDLITLFEEEFIPDPEVKAIIDSMQYEVEKEMSQVVGEAEIHLTRGQGAQSLIGNLVMDAVLEEIGADFAFTNLGGIRADIQKGPVTYRDIFEVLPFGNEIVTVEMSGALLKEILEIRVSYNHQGLQVAGGEVVYNRNLPNFQRVTKIVIGGKEWDPNETYTVATTDFLMQGNAGLTILTEIPEEKVNYLYIIMRDAVANYFKRHKVVSSQIDDRWKMDPEAQPSPKIAEYNHQRRVSASSGY
jgi:2',3'-cyclic-nucleotide 2'-phosphodiesterase (5'-nucleotidase family)